MDHATARALADAGYLPLPEYLRLCRENGWEPEASAVTRARVAALSVALAQKGGPSALAALAATVARR